MVIPTPTLAVKARHPIPLSTVHQGRDTAVAAERDGGTGSVRVRLGGGSGWILIFGPRRAARWTSAAARGGRCCHVAASAAATGATASSSSDPGPGGESATLLEKRGITMSRLPAFVLKVQIIMLESSRSVS